MPQLHNRTQPITYMKIETNANGKQPPSTRETQPNTIDVCQLIFLKTAKNNPRCSTLG